MTVMSRIQALRHVAVARRPWEAWMWKAAAWALFAFVVLAVLGQGCCEGMR